MTRLVAILLLASVAACSALDPRIDAVAPGSSGALLVLQQPSNVEGARLADLFDLEKAPAGALASRFQPFEHLAAADIEAALLRAGFAPAAMPVADAGAAAESTVARRYNARVAGQSGRLLRFRVTDLGYSPLAWKGWYAAWEISSTLVIAGVAFVEPVTRPIAGAYLLEESTEELLEGYAGFWALDRLWAPVRIEANLVDLQTGAVLWTGAHTGFADFRLGRVLHRPRDAVLDGAIGTALGNAAEGLVARMQRALR